MPKFVKKQFVPDDIITNFSDMHTRNTFEYLRQSGHSLNLFKCLLDIGFPLHIRAPPVSLLGPTACPPAPGAAHHSYRQHLLLVPEQPVSMLQYSVFVARHFSGPPRASAAVRSANRGLTAA